MTFFSTVARETLAAIVTAAHAAGVPGDATATAANIGSLESLWRIGVASEGPLYVGVS